MRWNRVEGSRGGGRLGWRLACPIMLLEPALPTHMQQQAPSLSAACLKQIWWSFVVALAGQGQAFAASLSSSISSYTHFVSARLALWWVLVHACGTIAKGVGKPSQE